MALPVFPTNLIGLGFDVLRTRMDSTRVLTSRSGKEYRAANWSFGKYKYQLTYNVLRSDTAFQELQTLFGFCGGQQGMFAPFLYTDPSDHSATAQLLGTGTGSQTAFPFIRAFGGVIDPVLAVNAVTQVTVAGTPTAAYTLSQAGAYGTDTLNMNSAPANGAAVAATFSFYWPCRFLQDDPEFTNFAFKFWSLKTLAFQTLK